MGVLSTVPANNKRDQEVEAKYIYIFFGSECYTDYWLQQTEGELYIKKC